MYSTPYRFTGHEKDEESGLHYAHARYLSTDLSISLSVDPMYMKYPVLTPYHYCGNNPEARVDPSGEENVVSFNINNESDQKLQQYGQNYIRNEPVVHLWSHGMNGGSGISIYQNKTKEYLTKTSQLHEYLCNNSKIYNENENNNKTTLLVMHSCQVGKKGEFAQEASKDLNLLVVAPSENITVSLYENGKGNDEVENNGGWIIYYKGEKMDSFSGKSAPIFRNPEKTIEKYEKLYQQKYEQQVSE